MRIVCFVIAAAAFGTAARAQTVQAPQLASGDRWTYQETAESRTGGWRQTTVELSVVRVGSGSIFVSSKPAGSTMPATEIVEAPDWSRTRSVNGKQTLVNRPLAFPLSPGKTWSIDYTEQNPNRGHASETFDTPYKAIGWESVTVPAGTYRAIKIEGEGTWAATIAPAVTAGIATRVDGQGTSAAVQTNRVAPQTVSGRLYKGFWYAPEVKRWVKSEEEYFDANGVRNQRFTQELVQATVSGP